jgi:putative transcriptional regulator
MKEEDFSLLLASIKQVGEIQRGERKATRRKTISVPDIPKIRRGLGLSQSEFALLIGVSPRTLQNWEQKRREPEGPAKALLMVAARNPKMVLEALHG